MICIDPFKNLNISNVNNKISISPCCWIEPKETQTIDFVNNEYLNSIRLSWLLDNFPQECFSCQKLENANMFSRRMGANQWYEDNNLNNTDIELVRIDYWTGDLCNLKCVICGPKNSSSWKQEIGIPIVERKVTNNKIWKTLDLSTIRYIHFNGGEPLLSKEHVSFLLDIPHKNLVSLFYNTNGTILPDSSLLNLWEQFKLVEIYFSIDDIGERFNYQRYPAKWNDVVNNLQFFKDKCPVNCVFGVNTTLSILNNNNYENLLKWLSNNFFVNRVNDPVEYQKQLAHGILSLENVNQNKEKIKSYLDNIDMKRGTNWRNTFPDIIKML